MLQIIGTKKCKETMKALRFFKERGMNHQFVDLAQRSLSRGELEHIAGHLGADNLVDRDSREFKKRGMEYMVYDPLEELEENPGLLKTPVIRTRKQVLQGFNQEELLALVEDLDG